MSILRPIRRSRGLWTPAEITTTRRVTSGTSPCRKSRLRAVGQNFCWIDKAKVLPPGKRAPVRTPSKRTPAARKRSRSSKTTWCTIWNRRPRVQTTWSPMDTIRTIIKRPREPRLRIKSNCSHNEIAKPEWAVKLDILRLNRKWWLLPKLIQEFDQQSLHKMLLELSRRPGIRRKQLFRGFRPPWRRTSRQWHSSRVLVQKTIN